MFRHLMTSWHLNIWAFEVKQKTFFLVSKELFFKNTKQTSKNVAKTIFKLKKLLIWGTVFQNGKWIADIFKKYFCNIVKKLSIPKDPCSEDGFSIYVLIG